MQDEINEKVIGIIAQAGKLTADVVQQAIQKALAEMEKTGQQLNKTPTVKHGEQTMKQLAAQNAGLSSVELTDPQLQLLKRELKKSGVDFSAVKAGKGKYVLFFKGRDADAITHAFNQYSQTRLSNQIITSKRLCKSARNKSSGEQLIGPKATIKAVTKLIKECL